jgi:hypothetical protein
MKVIKSADCGNSPKNLLVQSLAAAIETGNASSFSRCVSDDVVWAIPGRRSFQGKAAALAYLKTRKPDAATRVLISHAISHGRSGAGNGNVSQGSGLSRGFCHVIEFASARGDRVAGIFSYYSDLGDVD